MSAAVVIVDTGGANLASVGHALSRLGRTPLVSADADTIRAAAHVILPGVGAAGDTMRRLEARQLRALLPTLTQPVLGICLGMHLFAEHSDEDDVACLGLLPGSRAVRLAARDDAPVPHMGWNTVTRRRDSRLLAGVDDRAYFYFVHSYAMPVDGATAAVTDYGETIAAVIERDNFVATQFHPERSAANGRRVLENFLAM
ncbi:MAG: imidazole glycerol phosphate synthase subunit HisH [Pseudomonadota bacterium]